MAMASSGQEEDVNQLAAELSKTLKDGERILAPTRRPDGSLRKPIRIRAGYVPQDEVAKYQSKGALWKKEMQSLQEVPPGYDLDSEAKPKTKAAKRNERKKEKRQQVQNNSGIRSTPYRPAGTIACLEGTLYTSEPSLDDKLEVYELEVYELKEETDEEEGGAFYNNESIEFSVVVEVDCGRRNDAHGIISCFCSGRDNGYVMWPSIKLSMAALDKGKNSDKNEDSAEDASQGSEPVDSVVSQMNGLAISSNSAVVTPPLDVTESSTPSDHISDIDKRIRALKKKIRLSEAQQQKTIQQEMKPEQMEKMTKLEGWRNELKLLEDRKAELLTS
ncbi:hypothetical protein RHSIM_Rhsim11G0131600 [Rhododendron simsii]|uniref:WIBG Mago-binding domain-containing protein n=1 Tax=Rhododendron simsii TaxID=118357 RepID=A0A834GB50_RHOSS|nr:hypothetical protein RHSIM_Rhsim11G0131600 [Rhododendron simsii]